MTAQLFDTTVEFANADERDAFLNGLQYRRLPVKGQLTWASDGFDDYGHPIVTFARQARYTAPGQPIVVRLTDVAKKNRS